MKKVIGLFLLLMVIFSISKVYAKSNIGYARCNLKVIKGSYITWINWQASPTFIPVGTKLEILSNGAHLKDVKTGLLYNLDMGARGDVFLEKFIIKKSINIKAFDQNVQINIRNAVAKVGMTKEEAYIAMGPPVKVDGGLRTNIMTYDGIMKYNLWLYARRRFGKTIGVAFDPVSGKVNRTEGIWGK